MKTIFRNLKGIAQAFENHPGKIVGANMDSLSLLEDAFLIIEDDRIIDFGPMKNCPLNLGDFEIINGQGKFLLPSFVDSHTHLVFSHTREGEFEDRIQGLSYEEIAKNGGGILNSAARLHKTSESELFASAQERLESIISMGTGAVEIKSGYGLSLEDELKMLRVASRLQELDRIPIKRTFLGAHAFPKRVSREVYMAEILEEMIPTVADQGLADYIDVFCDRGFFTADETSMILEAGAKRGLKGKIHANELDYSGGVQVGVAYNAVSVDHLECMGEEEIQCLLQSETIPTLLPGTAFFLGLEYPPARRMIDSGLPIALASDYNPGSCPSGNMNFVMSLACVAMKMTPNEALNATTINASYALELENEFGIIQKGRPANFFLTHNISSLAVLPYSFGETQIDSIYIKGQKQ